MAGAQVNTPDIEQERPSPPPPSAPQLSSASENFASVEHVPEFPGGITALQHFIAIMIQYPKSARDNNIEGRVIAQFVVDTLGEITNIKITKSLDPDCDKEVVRVISAMPRWIPGSMNGQKVRVYYTLPITFRMPKK